MTEPLVEVDYSAPIELSHSQSGAETLARIPLRGTASNLWFATFRRLAGDTAEARSEGSGRDVVIVRIDDGVDGSAAIRLLEKAADLEQSRADLDEAILGWWRGLQGPRHDQSGSTHD